MPTDTKKMLAKISRKGSTLLVAWWLYSDSEMMRPARKAPRASDRPMLEVSRATEKHSTTVVSTNSSLLLVRATRYMSRGTTYRALAITNPMMNTPFASSTSSDTTTLSD
jgi:hypothetical protein